MSEKRSEKKLWGGRFDEPTDQFVERFTASVDFDQRLYRYDIQGSIAHSMMLQKIDVLTAEEQRQIEQGLRQIESRISEGHFKWSTELEDVHMNIEAALTELIGDAGKKLHTARSRNDQVATDIRLYLRDEIGEVIAQLTRLQTGLVELAQREADTIMPGFTHLQVAQPITFGHHMMAWYEMLERDFERLSDCLSRVNRMPLGAAALAGTTYPVEREYTAKLLGFDGICDNSLDAVSDRDFAIEFVSVAALIMTHLSRFSEELVLWTSAQFNFIELPDRFCTGSSIMPQKKNPDVPELIRGKTGRVNGHLISLLTLMKGQPLAYNKDNQEDKEPLFDTVDTVRDSLRAYADMIPSIQANRPRLYEAASQGFATATDLADYLVRVQVPFREAHEIVGKLVRIAIEKNCDLSDLELEEMQKVSQHIGDDIYTFLTLEGSVNARDHAGGTAPNQVRKAAAAAALKLQNR
ncbi:MAG: argininosuccinate lyase [Pseudomonadales bacterium]|nr:argininosuccinate lyase [Pseudomonadales bacterium]